MRCAIGSMPIAALITTAAVSTASSAGNDWPSEIGGTRRVDQVHPRAGVVQMQDRGIERVLHPALQRIVIAHRAASFEAADGTDHAGAMQQGFRQARLPSSRRTDQRQVCGWRQVLGDAGLGMGVLLEPGLRIPGGCATDGGHQRMPGATRAQAKHACFAGDRRRWRDRLLKRHLREAAQLAAVQLVQSPRGAAISIARMPMRRCWSTRSR